MSSLTRRIQRAHSPKRKDNPSKLPNFGTKLGVTNDVTKPHASATK